MQANAYAFARKQARTHRFGPYYAEPVIAGMDEKTGEPFICSMDLIGCINFAKDFVVSGTASQQMYGMCESLWEPDLVGGFCCLCFADANSTLKWTRRKCCTTGARGAV
jgi:20S proteasome alpha/beta subunit